jgi:hypothetical protein
VTVQSKTGPMFCEHKTINLQGGGSDVCADCDTPMVECGRGVWVPRIVLQGITEPPRPGVYLDSLLPAALPPAAQATIAASREQYGTGSQFARAVEEDARITHGPTRKDYEALQRDYGRLRTELTEAHQQSMTNGDEAQTWHERYNAVAVENSELRREVEALRRRK